MEQYKNRSGNSTVKAYQISQEGITIYFANGEVYDYDYAHTGRAHIENMKLMAQVGEGLGTYISVVAKLGYARQLR